MTDPVALAVLGTGLMGFPMARNLARAGHRVAAWNRDAAKAAPLAQDGIACAQTPEEAVAGADMVISMVTDGAAMTQLMDALTGSGTLRGGMLWVDMSSTRPEEARAAQGALAGHGVAFVDAPVSGGTRGAQSGTLAIMAGGAAQDVARAAGPLAALGRVVHVGPTGTGQLAKLANQAIVGITIGAVAEAMLLLERGGADTAAVRDALRGGFADSTILQQHGARMEARDFTPGGPSAIQLKDMTNIAAQAQATGIELPLVAQIAARYAHYVTEMDGGARDHSGLFEELLARNRLG